MKREQILMLVTLLLVAFLSWRLISTEHFTKGPARVRSLSLELDPLRTGDPVVDLEVAGEGRHD